MGTSLLLFDPGKVQMPFPYWLRPGVTQVQIESFTGFSGGSNDKESACSAGDLVLIPGSGRSPGEGNGYPLQYSCLENPMDRQAWQAIVHGFARVSHD